MDWGVHLPHLGRQATREGLIDFARRVEGLGMHSGWVSDHIAWPRAITSSYPYTDDGAFPASPDLPWLDPIGTLFFVAACTERLRLGSSVLILGYRPPVLTAKAIASLDVLSGGRAILGVGVGWMREEFDVLDMPFDHRGARADEQLEIFASLFNDESPRYEGSYYAFPEVGFFPRPVQSPLPVWVGGNSPSAYRRAARFGAAIHAAFEPVEDVADAWQQVREHARAMGRDPSEQRLSVRLYLDPEGVMDPVKAIAGSPPEMRTTIGRWAEIGADHILLDPVARGGLAGRLAAIEQFMAEVAPAVG